MREFLFELGERKIKVLAQRSSSGIWMHFDGKTRFVPDPSRKRAGGAAAAGATGEVLSPMPGKVIKLIASVGDDVKAGDQVVVIEAMKMEYTLNADIDGTVAEVNFVEGDQVKLGDTLVRVEPSDG